MRPRNALGALLAVALALLPGRAVSAREGPATSLADRIAKRVSEGGIRAGKLGLCVVSLESGEVVATSGADVPLVPASVAKVVTAAAALDLLGPGFVYETAVDARGTFDPRTGTLDGDLVVHGSGDPNLSKRGHEGDAQWPLSVLSKSVASRGVRRVTGAVYLDDGAFDRRFTHPSWSAKDLTQWYGAPVAGLAYNDSCDGADRPVRDPLAWFGTEFVEALSAAGVAVGKGARPAASPDERAAGARLAAVEDDLRSTLRVMNKKSQNFYASLVFKACGAATEGAGTWETGGRAVLSALSRRGVADPNLRLVDGSGLSDENRLTAGALARLLASFDHDVLRGPILRDSLAVPGEDGTLQKRLKDPAARARVRAKTGTLSNSRVHSLTGYVDGRGGARGFAFAILLNANPADGDPKDLIDDVVHEMLEE